MTEQCEAQFTRLAREVLNLRSDEWNQVRSSHKDRLSSFLFFLRGRGKELLEQIVRDNEFDGDSEFIDFLLHTVPVLFRLPLSILPSIPDPPKRVRTMSKSQRKKINTKAEQRPMIRSYHRVMMSSIIADDEEHDYSDILFNLIKILVRVEFPGLLHLRPISDTLRTFTAAHRERDKTKVLIELFNVLRDQLSCEQLVIEDGSQTKKMFMEMTSIAKLLLLDGEEDLGLKMMLILIHLLRRVQLDHLYSAGWCYTINLQLLKLTPLSNFSNIKLLEEVVNQIHTAEVILRRRINFILSASGRTSAVYPTQHWNGEHAEKLFSFMTLKEEGDICLFAKFTKSLLILISISSNDLVDILKNVLSRCFICCCLPIAEIFDKIKGQRFSFLPYLLTRCEQPKCPRCVTRDSKIWSPLGRYKFSQISSDTERIQYFHTLLHLTSVLPKNANRYLLDNVLMPLLSEKVNQLGRGSDNDSPVQLTLNAILITIACITFAPLGLFKTMLKILKTVDIEGSKKMLPIVTASMKVSTSNQIESLDQQKLAKEVILIFCRSTRALILDEVGFVKMENDQPMLDPSLASLTNDCLFFLKQFYIGIVHSELLRKLVFKNKSIQQVIRRLLEKSILFVGNPHEIDTAAGDALYICIPKRHLLPLDRRVEIFSMLLGIDTFFASKCPVRWRSHESTVLADTGSDFVRGTQHIKSQLIPHLKIIIEASLEPSLNEKRRIHRRNRSDMLDKYSIEPSNKKSRRNSGYDGSREEEEAKLDHTPQVDSRKVLFPCIIKVTFIIFNLLWEDKSSEQEINGLMPILQTVSSLLGNSKNVKICAEHDVVRLVLENFSFLLDSEAHLDVTKVLLQLFSKSSRHYVSPAALQLVINKLTRPKPPITDITNCLKDLFETTSKLYASMQIPITIDRVYNNLFDSSATQSGWNNSVWNRGIIHQELSDFFRKRDRISWTFCFWLMADRHKVSSAEAGNPEAGEGDSAESFHSSKEGMVILQEEVYDINFMNGTHVVSFGGNDYMIQLWIEGNKFQLRIVTDGRDGRPPGILAKQEVDIDLRRAQWDHVTFSAKEERAALKGHFAFQVVIQLNISTVFETTIEFPQFTKNRKSLRWTSMQWIFGDSRREEANEVFENSFRVSGSKIFRGQLMADNIVALYLLGPDNQDMTLTTCEDTTSPLCPTMTVYQYEFLKYNIEVGNIDLDQSLSFKPNLNILRERIFLSWNAKSPETIWLHQNEPSKSGIFSSSKVEPFSPLSQKARVIRAPLLQGQIRADRSAALDSAVYQLGGIRPFLLLFSNSLTPSYSTNVQVDSLYVLLSCIRMNLSFAKDFHQLKGHQMVKQVIQAGRPSPEIFRTLVEFCCHGKIFSEGQLLENTNAVITDTSMLNLLILDCSLWCVDATSWALQFQVLKALVHDNHQYRSFNVKTLVQAGAVLKLLETLQIALSERPSMDLPHFVGDMMVDLIRALIGYPPDTQIISKVFDFCCSIHPPAEAYVTNSRKKFYFYPRFENANGSQSMQTKLERSQSLDALTTLNLGDMTNEHAQAIPKLIRCQSANFPLPNRSFLNDCSDDNWSRESKGVKIVKPFPRELFGPESLGATPSDSDPLDSDALPSVGEFEASSELEGSIDIGECRGATHSGQNEWDVVRRTNSDASAANTLGDGTANLVNGLLEVLRHAVVLLPDIHINTVLNDMVINWESLVVLCNSTDDGIRCSSLRLFLDYLQRANTDCRHRIVREHAFMLLANQLYQHRSTVELVEAALLLISSRAEPLLEATSGSVRDLDPTALPAVAPLLSLIENSVGDDFVLDLVCMNVKSLFEVHNELGDTMLDRGLSIVICNSVYKQVSMNQPLSSSLLSLLHAVVIRCATTNTEHFLIVADILDSLEHLERKEIEIDDEHYQHDPSISADVCEPCSKVAEIRRIIYSVHLVAIESLMNTTELGVSPADNDDTTSMFKEPEKLPSSTMSTPKRTSYRPRSPTVLKISEADLVTRVGVLVKSATSKVQFQGPPRCRLHNDLITDELSAKFSHLSSQLNSASVTVDNDSAFAIKIFDILLYWVSEASHFDTYTRFTAFLRTGKDSARTRLARRLMLRLPLAHQFMRLIIFMLSPGGGKVRLIPLRIVKEPERKNILLFIFPGAESEAEQMQLYLQYISYYHSANMKQEDIDDIDALSGLLTELGYDLPTDVKQDCRRTEAKQRGFEYKRHRERESWIKSGNEQFRQLLERAITYSDHIATSSSEVTQVVVNRQNLLRRRMTSLIKTIAANDVKSRDVWRRVIAQLNHERAVWHNPAQSGLVWQLAATEGPHGERRRLERAMPRIKPKFVRSTSYEVSNEPDSMTSLPMMNFLKEDPAEDTLAVIEWLHTHEQINATEKCRKITPEHEAKGELLLSPTKIFYVGDEPLSSCFVARGLIDESGFCKHWMMSSVKRLNRRWFGLIDCALEVAFADGRTEMFAFGTFTDRERVFQILSKYAPPGAPGTSLADMTIKWQKGELSNFAYLMVLNTHAGRTFNDLMQYPVFPFILSNYTEDSLDLSSSSTYRNLAVPISVQSEEKREMFQERYHFLAEEYKRNPHASAPYHYGSHYSNSGTVLHFLLRLPPFTKMFLEYQDQSFDLPDRTFHAVATAWKLASHDSSTDVKELVPEFFFLPEFLLNNENFNFGVRQNGKRVHHVTLPPWCGNDARMFISIHRQALESAHVSSMLHHWIDLVFGYKVTGLESINACNVFHPMTYFGVDVSSEPDPVKRTALETMIRTYGQTPKQLFTSPHPQRAKSDIDKLKQQEARNVNDVILPDVHGLKWGNWCGSPTLSPPVLILKKSFNPSSAVVVTAFGKTDCAVLPPNNRLVGNSLLSFDHDDRILRLKTARTRINLLKPEVDDRIVCAEPISNTQFIIGYSTGIAQIWNVSTKKSRATLCDSCYLIGHSARIHAFAVCQEFSIIVSASEDGSAIIWDLNSGTYVRSLQGHPAGVNCVATASETGEIVTVCSKDDQRHSQLRLWTINGQLVAACDATSPVLCTKWTNAVEGRACNAIITGHLDGSIQFWSSINLSHIRTLTTTASSCISIALSDSGQILFSLGSDGLLSVWAQSENQRETRKPLVVPLEKSA